MTAYKHVLSQAIQSGMDIQATTWSICGTDHFLSLLESEIYGITSNDQIQFRKEFSIHLMEFQAWWQSVGSQEI